MSKYDVDKFVDMPMTRENVHPQAKPVAEIGNDELFEMKILR
jgi:hypothetical protein